MSKIQTKHSWPVFSVLDTPFVLLSDTFALDVDDRAMVKHLSSTADASVSD
jgi:hypothetical protein